MNDFSAVTVNRFHPSHGIRNPPVSYSQSPGLSGARSQRPPLPWTAGAPCFPRPHSLTQHPPTTQPLPVTSRGEESAVLFHALGKSGKKKMICPGGKALWGLEASLCIPAPSPHSHLGHRQLLKHYRLLSPQAFLSAMPPTLTTSLSSRAQGLFLILKSQLWKALGH